MNTISGKEMPNFFENIVACDTIAYHSCSFNIYLSIIHRFISGDDELIQDNTNTIKNTQYTNTINDNTLAQQKTCSYHMLKY